VSYVMMRFSLLYRSALDCMRRGILERKIENVETGVVLKRKRSDGEEGREGEEDGEKGAVDEEPPVSRQRRVSILPGSLAYNEAITASFDAVELGEEPNESAEKSDEEVSSDAESEPPITYTVDEPPDDSVSEPELNNFSD